MICSPLLAKQYFSRQKATGVHRISKGYMVVSVRSNLPQKSSTVLSEPKLDPPPPNEKFVDPPLQ